MNSDFRRTLRRLKPGKKRRQLSPRDHAQLPFLEPTASGSGTLIYDTTVYIDILHGNFSEKYKAMIRAADVWHSTVTEAELAISCALLDPTHPGTRNAIKKIIDLLNRRPVHRSLAPDREIWREAGLLAGMIMRLQQLRKSDQPRILNDALIFCTARKFGHTVLTRNIRDFDFLNQLDPLGRVLFYRV